MWSVEQITSDLKDLGVPNGASLLVHASMRSIGKTENGAEGVIEAMLAAVGPEGTIMAPTFTLQFCDPAEWASPPETEAEIERIRSQAIHFERDTTPSDQPRMGIFSEILRRHPDAVRSDHPTLSFAALGKAAALLTSSAPFHYPLGSDSPLARLHNTDGWVLLIGVGHEVNSSIHLAEVWANAPYTHNRFARVKTGANAYTSMQGEPGCSDGFVNIELVLRQARLMRRGYVGNAPCRLMRQRELVSMAIAMLKGNPESLLCDRASCKDCSLARTFTAAGTR
jgi:aminoglycoside 3-N-acetyltransferase